MSMASLWNPPKATEGPDGNAHRDTFNHFPAALADWDLKIPADDQTANVMPVQKKGWKEHLGMSPCQSDLGAREGHGADPLECHDTAHAG